MSLIDIHAHLTFKSFKKDLDDVIMRAKNNGLIAIINSTIDPKDFYKGLNLIKKYKNYVFLSIGAAPQTIDERQFHETLEIIEKYINYAVAIGEIGLDYYWIKDVEKRAATRRMFRELALIAIAKDKPIVIHNRDAFNDVAKTLEDVGAERVVFHAFMGGEKEAEKIIRNGWYISIPTILARSKKHQDLIKKIDLEHIMLETDSPFLAPWPRSRNEPANVKVSAELIAKIKELPYQKVCEQVTENAINFFSLPIHI